MVKTTQFFFLLFGIVLIFNSCRNSDRDLDTDTTIARSYAFSEQYFSDPFFWTHKLLVNPALTQNNLTYLDSVEGCLNNVSIIKNATTNITDFTLVFDETTTCNDGRVRKGQIEGRVWGSFKDENSTIRITSSFYYINGFRVNMVDSLQNLGRDLDSSLVFSSHVRNAVISNDTNYIEWDANHEWTWSFGEKNRQYVNDELKATGLIKSLSYNGNSYTAEIIEPLMMDLGCYWITEGKVNQQPENILPRTLNFGSNSFCDNLVDVRISQRDYEIKID
jgi:hypothetical protein